MEKIIYIVIDASNGTIANDVAYEKESTANAVRNRLCEIACNPNSYYVQSIDLK